MAQVSRLAPPVRARAATMETTSPVWAARNGPRRGTGSGRWGGGPPASPQRVEAAILGGFLGGQPSARFPGGETFGALEERGGPAWRELLAQRDWRQVLIVAQGVVNRLLLCRA